MTTLTFSARLILPSMILALAGCGSAPPQTLGTIERERVELIAEQQEPIVEILVHEGEAVKAGQPLLRMDPSRVKQSVLAAKATAQLSELEGGGSDRKEARARLYGAHLTEAEISLDRLTVAATRDGVVDALPFKLGNRPPPGAVVAVLLAGAPYARVYVPEILRARIATGAAAEVHVDGFSKPFNGRVRTLANEAAFTPYYALTDHDRGRLSYLSEIDLTDESAQTLPTGIPVTVRFPGADNK